MELDWIGKDSIWSSNLHWNEGWKLIILELMSNNDSMWIRTQINRWAWPDHCWYNVMYLKNSILSCQLQFALRWRLRDSISRFKVNWSLSQSFLSVSLFWSFYLFCLFGFFSSWLCTVLNGWSATEPRIDVLPGGLAVRMGPWAALPWAKKSPPEMHLGKHTWIKLGAVLLPISRSAIWTTLKQGKTDF